MKSSDLPWSTHGSEGISHLFTLVGKSLWWTFLLPYWTSLTNAPWGWFVGRAISVTQTACSRIACSARCLCCHFKVLVPGDFFPLLRESVDFDRNTVILPVGRCFRSCCNHFLSAELAAKEWLHKKGRKAATWKVKIGKTWLLSWLHGEVVPSEPPPPCFMWP